MQKIILYLLLASTLHAYDREVVIKTLYNEAEGEPIAGKIAVMNVIQNRARLEKVPFDTIVLDSRLGRFSGARRVGRAGLPGAQRTRAWKDCANIVSSAERNVLPDLSKGALYFENVARYGYPSWYFKGIRTETARIGNHVFFKPTL